LFHSKGIVQGRQYPLNTQPVWEVLNVSWVPSFPIDWPAIIPTTSPNSIMRIT
jgi:hypothetical protein